MTTSFLDYMSNKQPLNEGLTEKELEKIIEKDTLQNDLYRRAEKSLEKFQKLRKKVDDPDVMEYLEWRIEMIEAVMHAIETVEA